MVLLAKHSHCHPHFKTTGQITILKSLPGFLTPGCSPVPTDSFQRHIEQRGEGSTTQGPEVVGICILTYWRPLLAEHSENHLPSPYNCFWIMPEMRQWLILFWFLVNSLFFYFPHCFCLFGGFVIVLIWLPRAIWDHSSLMRDWTHALGSENLEP